MNRGFDFLREWLFQYGSMKEVFVEVPNFERDYRITYVLCTDERRTVTIPMTLIDNRNLDGILALFEQHLGELPYRTRNRD